MDIERLGVSGITTNKWSLQDDVKGYARHGVKNIGIWTYKCDEVNPREIRDLVEAHGLHVSNLCFSGLFTGDSALERQQAIENTKRHIDIAKEIGAGCLLLVSGPIHHHSLWDATQFVREALFQVTEYAEEQEMDLGLEALHPLELTTYSVINTVSLAMELIESVNSERLGIFLDTYNNGWDHDLRRNIQRCTGKIKGVHLADWRNPARSFTDRALPGTGVLPIPDIVKAIEESGYTSQYELEIFSDELWDSDYDELIEQFKSWYLDLDIGR